MWQAKPRPRLPCCVFHAAACRGARRNADGRITFQGMALTSRSHLGVERTSKWMHRTTGPSDEERRSMCDESNGECSNTAAAASLLC